MSLESIYKFEKKLGSGANGTVYLAYDKKTKEPRAVKLLAISISEVEKEFDIASMVSLHPNCHKSIICYYAIGEGSYKNKHYTFIEMEYFEGHTLNYYNDEVLNGKKINYNTVLNNMINLFEGLAYLHMRGVAHRDIKPENIMYNDHSIVFVDLGLSCVYGYKNSKLACDNSRTGTPLFWPHEVVEKQAPINWFKADVFSLALSWILILTKFKDTNKNDRNGIKNQIELIKDFLGDKTIPKEIKSILGKCIRYLPSERPSAKDAYKALLELARPEIVV